MQCIFKTLEFTVLIRHHLPHLLLIFNILVLMGFCILLFTKVFYFGNFKQSFELHISTMCAFMCVCVHLCVCSGQEQATVCFRLWTNMSLPVLHQLLHMLAYIFAVIGVCIWRPRPLCLLKAFIMLTVDVCKTLLLCSLLT